MLVYKGTKFLKSPFNSEQELEKVITENYEYLFGPNSFYLPKAKIKTADGAGTIPDGFVIDIAQRKWYLVEAELIYHSVWNHIAPQITKQILASQQHATKRIIIDLSVDQYTRDSSTKEKFDELGIIEINVRQVLGDILDTDPIIGVPIDGITNDLKDWARTLKYKVKLWLISKFVEFNNPLNVVYEFPEEFRPELDTEEEQEEENSNRSLNKYEVEITDLISNEFLKVGDILYMFYKPRNGELKKYEATVMDDGSLSVLDQIFGSPSNAALAGINNAGSDRKTVNGWTSWKTSEGVLLSELREHFLRKVESMQE